ncbi:MAG: CDP-alcohol phosphatidyltransferase family protein [Elusimicrobia bacterium]|jgi:CDP-diacylglycerol--glycerol-3-phosphate 3-phosphatidyltransferase|nr:MAG: CDP-alcohol phosphatidyltransferase family protein [Elusimicrobiota bacterium]
MPSVYDVKPKFQALLRPAVGALARAGVTANQVTIAAAVLSFAAGAALVARAGHPRWLFLLPVVLLVRMALNAVDGMLAREHNQKSARGAVLNELGDVFSDAALYAPLALWPGFSPVFVAAIVFLALATEMTGVVAVQIGAARRYDGPLGKSDRALLFGVLGLLLGLGVPTGRWLTVVQGLAIVLLLQTVWNRAKNALKDARP